MTSIEDFTRQYGLVQKIDAFGYLDYLKNNPDAPRKHGKVVLVTADTPLKASRGEGKTTTTIALIDALNERGIDAAAVLRQPSMGITAAGSKGGASGGGKASLTHPELIDWGLCGEMGAIEAAQNLLVSFAEKAVDEGKLDTILVPRVSEVPSRSLRQIAVDRGKGDVPERVVLTPTCELMQIVVLSRSMDEIAERVSKMIAGTKDGKGVTFGEFVDLWRITGILSDAVKPAKTETVNGSPVYVHGGPFANVSIGIPTLVSVEMACALHDVVIVEAGYGTDAGAQKWLDIACREFDAQWPSAAVVVTRASTWRDDPELAWRYPFHVQRLEGLDIPTFPLINLWEGEDDQVPALKQTAKDLEFREPIVGNLFRDGGEALAPQLDAFVDVLQNAAAPARPSSHSGMSVIEDAKWVAEHAYGVPADRILLKDGFVASRDEAIALCESVGIDITKLALVAVKSPATMTDNDRAPEDERTVTLKKVEVHAGAGLVHVNLTTSLTTPMPKIV
ncbi:MAG: formate--tetrahydrofolate ligase [Bifidobacterium merycicum]|uniref:formate--tetrahydrofolate ligase n=1 Tax=Bifidobacterium merycicum TaxID=78345 RepID=A0A087BED8_9BIFI|nr:formate--tetrahydrofolate ligase [Bifidobacterium merycicum]KFI69388.1 formate-tetrahydrofolate ligase [Bifidobacterium merycicum]MEE1295033.1 formate--tetrahydrofolate ligase [Bifidobacterium merycicum]MEE3341101.1 formate--tetrahydrofolate ligase [Bifidobacterium merycicum]SHE68614.1 Formate-tetrahydrofolate ligase [Bifidobacterium merycicum DSM 6492]